MSEKLTIAHVMGYYMPGLGYQENFLPSAQASLGHDVHIVTGDRHVPHANYATIYQPRLGPRQVGTGVRLEGNVTLHRLKVAYEVEKRQNPALSGLVRRLEEIAPDVIHLHGVNTLCSLQVMVSSLWRKAALVCDHHVCAFNLEPFTRMKQLHYALYRNLVLPPLRQRVRAWLPISDDAREVLARQLGIVGSNVFVNHLGVDCTNFRRDRDLGSAWRERHGLPLDRPIAVHAGKLEARKNVHVLVEAFRRAPADALLVIVGSGPEDYLGRLRSLADDRVRFLPIQPHSELPAIYNGADLGVWPGDDSITLLEARGCGLPLVLSEASVWSEACGQPGCWLVLRGAVAPLAEVLANMPVPSENERKAIAGHVFQTLSWQVIAAQSVEIYARILGRTAGAV